MCVVALEREREKMKGQQDPKMERRESNKHGGGRGKESM